MALSVPAPSGLMPFSRCLRFFRQVASRAPYALFLGGGDEPSPLNRRMILGVGARQIIRLSGETLSINGETQHLSKLAASAASNILFTELEAARQRAVSWGKEGLPSDLPFYGGLAGALGYGFYRWCDEGWQGDSSEIAPTTDMPDLLLFECEDWLFLEPETDRLTILSQSPEREAEYAALWRAVLSSAPLALSPDSGGDKEELSPDQRGAYLATFRHSLDAVAFEDAANTLKQAIRRGELYQANLSLRLEKKVCLDPLDLFEHLCRRNPSPFSGFLRWPGGVIVSNSPERLIQVDPDGQVRTRPIAGTRGRGDTPEDDARIGQTLLENEKELAEHRMLVDLARNDLGRICRVGSVRVDDLLALERYSHVTHLVSNVTGRLRADAGPWDALRALFPGGTITGCPKVRCVELLNRVEPVSRGFYTGSLGYLDARGPGMDWNILIRSLFLRETDTPLTYNTHIHVGAGIVHDAVGAYEYRECLRKAAAALNALYALESARSLP